MHIINLLLCGYSQGQLIFFFLPLSTDNYSHSLKNLAKNKTIQHLQGIALLRDKIIVFYVPGN